MGRGGMPERRGTDGAWMSSSLEECERVERGSLWVRALKAAALMDEDCELCTWISVQLCWYRRLWRTSMGRALVRSLTEAASMRPVRGDGAGREGVCPFEGMVMEETPRYLD